MSGKPYDHTYAASSFFERIAEYLELDWDDVVRGHNLSRNVAFDKVDLVDEQTLALILQELTKRLPAQNAIMWIMNLFPEPDHNAAFLALKFADNGNQAAQYLEQFQRLMSNFSITTMRTPDTLTITIDCPVSNSLRIKMLYMRLLFFLQIMRQSTGQRIVPIATSVAFDPEQESSLIPYLGVEPVKGDGHSMTFSTLDAAIAFKTADPVMNQRIIPELARRLLVLQGMNVVVYDVDRLIYDGFGRQSATLPDIAGQLGMSIRKLQRILADEGTTFSAILDNARRRRVADLAALGIMSKGQIAFDVGFNDTNSLYRAMAKWRLAD